MADVLLNVNRYADWSRVLAAVGARPGAAALPYRSGCPLCGCPGQFTVHADPVYSGQWFHCRGCGAAGDMIELAAGVWKVDVRTAARRLFGDGLLALDEDRLDSYLPWYADRMVAYRHKILAFWERCRLSTLPADSGAVRVLISRAGLTPEVDLDLWRRRTGRLVGACHRREAEEALRMYHESDDQDTNRGMHRPFVGRGWAEVLVVPGWDLPGRVRSFTFVGRQAGQNDVFVRQVNGTGRRMTELGLVGLPECLASDRVVVVDDPLDCLRLHDKYYRMHAGPFPVAARHRPAGGRETACWSALHGRRAVFWGMKTTTELVRLGRLTGGAVCGEDRRPDPATKHLSRLDPRVWLDGVAARARGWMDALDDRVGDLPAAAGETEVAALALTPAERAEAAGRPGLKALNARLRGLAAATGRTVTVDGRAYTETRDGWRRDGEPVFSARLRIDRLVATSQGAVYVGALGVGDREVPFRERVEVAERWPGHWIRRLAADAGVVVTLARGFNPIRVAQAFHPPVADRGRERCGWDGEAAGFVFADFTVTGRGVDPVGVVLADRVTPTAGCRADPLTAADWLALTAATPASALLWAVAGGVLAQVLAPAFGLPTAGVAVEGPADALGCRMAAWLGCGEHAPGLPKRTGKTLLAARWRRAETAHGWPVILGNRGAGPGAWFRAAVGAEGDRNCVAPCGWDEARVLALTGRWTVVSADAGEAEELRRPAAKLAAAFLGWLLGRGLRLPGEDGLAGRTLAAMAEWVRDQGHDPAAVRAGRALTEPAPSPAARPGVVAAAFGGLAGQLTDQGAGLGVVRDGGTAWVAKADVYRALRQRGLPPVDDAALTADLARAGVARAEDRYDPPVSGWAFDYGWWTGQLDRYRAVTRNTRGAG